MGKQLLAQVLLTHLSLPGLSTSASSLLIFSTSRLHTSIRGATLADSLSVRRCRPCALHTNVLKRNRSRNPSLPMLGVCERKSVDDFDCRWKPRRVERSVENWGEKLEQVVLGHRIQTRSSTKEKSSRPDQPYSMRQFLQTPGH